MSHPRAIFVSDAWTYRPGRRIAPPVKSLANRSITELVTAAAEFFAPHGEGVLIIDARAALRLRLPVDPAHLPAGDGHPAVDDLKQIGWQLSKLRAWTTLHAYGRPTVHLCLIDLVDLSKDRKAHPMITLNPLDTVDAMDAYHRLTGSAWRGNSGMAGIAIMRNTARVGAQKQEPTWLSKAFEIGTPEGATEIEYREVHWKGRPPRKGDKVMHSYDVNYMYLSAMRNTKLAHWDLKHTGVLEYAPDRAGWWKVRLSPWRDKKLPAPYGYAYDADDMERWVTGPTLGLLDQLVKAGEYDGYEVLDSWTRDGATEVLKSSANRIYDALTAPEAQPASGRPDVAALIAGLKGSYKRAWGMLNHNGSRIYRPDWAYAILAMARVNLFRAMRKAGEKSGRYPAWIATDAVYYPAPVEDPQAWAAELGFKITPPGGVKRLGEFECGTPTPLKRKDT